MGSIYSALDLRTRLMVELTAFALSFKFHDGNSFVRKATTVIFFMTWGIATILLMLGVAVELWMYLPMTAAVFYILGREHEAEIQRLLLR